MTAPLDHQDDKQRQDATTLRGGAPVDDRATV